MDRILSALLLPLCLAFVLAGCKSKDPSLQVSLPERAPAKDMLVGDTLFEQVQNGIFAPLCASCHNGTTQVPLDFSSLQHSKAALFTEDGQPKLANNPVAQQNGWLLVRPGEPEKSFLIRKLTNPGIGEGSPMPNVNETLSDEALALITLWIEHGAMMDEDSMPNMKRDRIVATAERVQEKLMFEDPDNCERCHPKHTAQWRISSHAYAAVDPVFLAMSEMGQEATKGKLGQFCMQCHSPVGFVRNEVPSQFNESTQRWEQDFSQLSDTARKGVSCDVCHSTTEVIEPFNAKVSMTPNGVKLGGIRDPMPTDAHKSAFSELHKTSEVCAACHNVVNPKGAALEETFTEWENSSFSQGPDKKTCQSCHMPESTGPAAKDGPDRTIHDHVMVGVDVSLLAPEAFPGYYELREKTEALLQGAAKLSAQWQPDNKTLAVTIQNLTGHSLPSGATAERQMWIEVTARSATGEVQFQSGMLDENGDLMDGNPKHSTNPDGDPQLVKFAQDMLDVEEVPVGEDFYKHVVAMPWQASGIKNHLLVADETKQFIYMLYDVSLPRGSTIDVKLKFRSFPMYFLRVLEDAVGLDPEVKKRVPIVEMQSVTLVFD